MNDWKNYKKKPVTIQAIQYIVSNLFLCLNFCVNFCDGKAFYDEDSNTIRIQTLEGVMTVSPGDYIIKGVKGEVYPCKPDIFEMTYEEVEE